MTTQTDINSVISTLVENALAVYKDIKTKDIMGVIVKLMESVETLPMLTGADKKQVVLVVLTQVVQRINFQNPAEKESLLAFINSGLVSIIIDGIIKLTKEGCKINVQQLEQSCSKCCGKKCTIM